MLQIGINGRSLFRQSTGVQQYSREITRHLLEIKPDDVSISVFAGREGRGKEQDLPLETSAFPANSPLRGIVWEQALLKRMAVKAGIDVLFNPANVAPLSPPVPSAVTIHDLTFLLFPQYFSRPFAFYYRALIPRVAAQARILITDSDNTKQDLVNELNLPAEKIRVVPLGVSRHFRRRVTKKEMEVIRRRHNLPPHFFLSISSLEPRKNLRRLVEAYRLLPPAVTEEYALVLAGTGNRIFAEPGLTEAIARLETDSVTVTGYIPTEDLPAVYRMSTALAFPSLYEGFGLPVLEAMAASTPVITSNRSSLPEVAGHAAVLIDPESTEEIAAAMELIATDSGTRTLLAERGKKRAALFTWEKAANKTLEILREAAEA